MRLHLPKGLLAALLAACFALPAGATQYRWGDADPGTSTEAGPEKSTDGSTWNRITYDGHTLTNTSGSITFTDAGDYLITGIPEGGWGSGTSVVAPTVDGVEQKVASAWFSATENKRIYMTGENINKMSNIFLTGVHFVVGTSGTSSSTHTIASNLFLGAGVWGGDTTNVHNVSTLRANVDTVINGVVSLVDDSVQISTWADKDITFSDLAGAGKTLSIGSDNAGDTDVLGSVINLNGKTTLGALSVGTQTNTSGILTAMGRAISVVIGEQGDATLGDVSLLSGSTLTNNGTLRITGTYYGKTISQGDSSSLTFGDNSIISLDLLDFSRGNLSNINTNGVCSYQGLYSIANGSVTMGNDVTYKLNNTTMSGSYADGVYTADQRYYNIVSGASADYSTITAGDAVDFIRVEGTLTAGSNVTHEIMLVGGALQGTGVAATYSGAITMTEDSSIKLNGNMTISESLTATRGKTLSVTMAEGATSGELNIGTGGAEPGLAKVGKLDGATLQIGDGVTVNVSGRSGGNAQIAGAIVVNGGGTLKLITADTLGYGGNGGGNFTDSITLQGSTDKTATLNLTATQTLTTSLILKGDTSITGEAMNSFDGTITATGTNNVISNELKIRKDLTITVNNSGDSTGSLEIAGKLGVFAQFYGVLTKDGDGTLIVSGTAGHDYTRSVTVNNGTLELRSAFTPVMIDLRGTDTTSGSLVISAGGAGTVNSGSGTGNGLWMDADSTVSILKAEPGESGTTLGGKLIFGTGATISATDVDASISSSTTGQYTFSSADFSLSNAEFLFNSTGQWGASLGNRLDNVAVINESSNLLLTVTHEGNTLRGIQAKGGNVVLDADTVVTGQRSISVGSGKQVQVNAGKTLTYDAFKYVGTTITSSDTAQGISLEDSTTTVSGGALTQMENHNTTEARQVGAKLENVKYISESGMKTKLTNKANSYTGLSVAGELTLADTNVTVSEVVLSGGSLTVGSSKTLTANSLKLATASGSVLTGNLTLADSAGLVVNVDGITADPSTAVCTLSGALTLGSGLTLTLENLGTFETGDAITLFSGVSGVTYTPRSTSEAEIAMLSGDTTKPLDATGVDASQIFGNLTPGDFKLTYSGADNGGIVALVAKRDVPEPTTATLSLLALMGLAARRRRRKA